MAEIDVNDWEKKPTHVMTEREKKEYARQRITSELDGNPNISLKKPRKIKFKPPTEEEKKRMELLDYLGNPKRGYKWGKWNKKKKFYEIIKDTEIKEDEQHTYTLNGFSIVNSNYYNK